ncbi:Beta-eliminating lyase [Popillia japonica]|uniref:Beta-eliminating lyase n=1 Tax=Popillia japonica TaxID=7064 RepID=A0AAW1MPG3_POPJA
MMKSVACSSVLPLEWLDKLSNIAKSHGIAVHMDGARVVNAAVASKVELSRIVRDMDSVCFCLSKSLAAPIGSVLLGTKAFIERAKRVRKVLGGGMRQAGIVAAAGIVALDSMIDQLRIDHKHLRQIAEEKRDRPVKSFHSLNLGKDWNTFFELSRTCDPFTPNQTKVFLSCKHLTSLRIRSKQQNSSLHNFLCLSLKHAVILKDLRNRCRPKTYLVKR